MKTGQLVGILIILVLILLGASFFLSGRVENNGSALPPEAMEGEQLEGGGEYVANVEESQIVWTGRKTFLDYEDRGTLMLKSGRLTIEDGVLVGGEMVVDMGTIRATSTGRGSGNERLAEHLKSADFFAVEEYPEATFSITSVSATGQQVVLTGDLTIKGITQEVTLPGSVFSVDGGLVLRVQSELDRTRWGIRYGSGSFFDDLGDNVIDDMFEIEVRVVANQA